MTLAMPDSIAMSALPPGYGQYLGYVDGQWPTYPELLRKFPKARNIGLTVTGAILDGAHGCDIETGDLTEDEGAQWARQKLNREPSSRPVLYASVGRMGTLLDRLTVWRVGWRQVRLLSAHYGQGEHICGPATCREVSIGMDGTQWTNRFEGIGFQSIDMSVLQDGFFGSWTEEIVQQLPVVQRGDTGAQVRTVQGLCVARLPVFGLTVDGDFGPHTDAAVKAVQANHKVTVDGVVGPLTWPVLLGIA